MISTKNIKILVKKYGGMLDCKDICELSKETIIFNIISDYEDFKKSKKSKKKRKKTGYNIFIKNTINNFVSKEPNKKFVELGKIWKAYSEEEKKLWQIKADVINEDEINEEPEHELTVSEPKSKFKI